MFPPEVGIIALVAAGIGVSFVPASWADELHKDQQRVSGEPYIVHPVAVARTLIDLNIDSTAVIAGLLHRDSAGEVAGHDISNRLMDDANPPDPTPRAGGTRARRSAGTRATP